MKNGQWACMKGRTFTILWGCELLLA